MSGKTTLAKKLSAERKSLTVRTACIYSLHLPTFPSLQHAFSSALGVPVNAGALQHKYFIKVLDDLGFSSVECQIFIDDLDVFFGGNASMYARRLSFIQDLISRFSGFRIIGTFSSFQRLELLHKDLDILDASPVQIALWSEEDDVEQFVKGIAKQCGLHPNQIRDEGFLKELLARSQGATGRIVGLIQTLSYSKKYADGRVLTRECFHGLWRG